MATEPDNKEPDKTGFVAEKPDTPEVFEPKDIIIGDASAPGGSPKPGAGGAATLPAPGALDGALDGAVELRRQLDAETGRREQAESLARAERARAIQAEQTAVVVGGNMIETSIQAWNKESGDAELAFEQAMASGDYRGAAKAQTRISDARVTLSRLADEKQNVEARSRAPRQETRVEPPAMRPAQDSRQAAMSISNNLTKDGFPKSAEWIRSHPELLSDQKSINKVSAAHGYVADVLGLVPETDAYFDKLEETLGMRQREAEVREDPPPPPPARDRQGRGSARPAAPTSPSVPNLSGVTRRQSVSLTAEQREHAHNVLGMTDEEYAAELVLARDNNKLIGAR